MATPSKELSTHKDALGRVLFGFVDDDGPAYGIKIDRSMLAIRSINTPHAKIHAGYGFDMYSFADLAFLDLYDIQFTTPDTSRLIHIVWDVYTEKEILWGLWEGVTVLTAATTYVARNLNRSSVITSGTTIGELKEASSALANTYTSTAGAIQLRTNLSGAGAPAEPGESVDRREMVLKQNTSYLMRILATAAGYVSTRFVWYEHTNEI